jgi:DNA replication protein DnaC
MICELCRNTASRPSPTDGLCWDCHRKATRGQPATLAGVLDGDPHRCSACGVDYVRGFPGAVCWNCNERSARAAEQRLQRRAECGVSRRHSRYLAWEDLEGPRPYRQAVAAVRTFAEAGDTVLAVLGKRGLGKTQALATAVWQTIERGRPARLVSAMQLVADLTGRYDDGGDAARAWGREWVRPHLLCIDEVAELVAGDHSRAALTALIDSRYANQTPTIVAGNAAWDGLVDVLGASVASRAQEGGGLVRFDGWGSFRAAVAA